MADSRIPKRLIEAARDGELVPFVGSGVSLAVSSADFPGWNTVFKFMVNVLREEAKEKYANLVEATASVGKVFDAANYAEDALGKGEFRRIVHQTYSQRHIPSGADLALPTAIWNLKARLVVTTNYDRVLEWTQPAAVVRCNTDAPELTRLMQDPSVDQPWIWHLHGHVNRQNTLILSPTQYARLYGMGAKPDADGVVALDRLKDLLTDRTLLFLGLGMRDRYLMEVMKQVLGRFQGYTGTHYALMKSDSAEEERLWQEFNVQVIPFTDYGGPVLDLVQRIGDEAFGPP